MHANEDWVQNWLKFSMFNQPIANTNLIPCKVPLDAVYANLFTVEEVNHQYNMETLLTHLSSNGYQVSTIIDFNRSDEYYCFDQFPVRKIVHENESRHIHINFANTALPKEFNHILHIKCPTSHESLQDKSNQLMNDIFTILDEIVELNKE